MERDVAVGWEGSALCYPGCDKYRVHEDWVGKCADADVVVENIVDEAAAGAVGLDTDGWVGAVEKRSVMRILQ
jgi:hypothetical protein